MAITLPFFTSAQFSLSSKLYILPSSSISSIISLIHCPLLFFSSSHPFFFLPIFLQSFPTLILCSFSNLFSFPSSYLPLPSFFSSLSIIFSFLLFSFPIFFPSFPPLLTRACTWLQIAELDLRPTVLKSDCERNLSAIVKFHGFDFRFSKKYY